MSGLSVHHVDPFFLQEQFFTVSSLHISAAWLTPTLDLMTYHEIKLSVTLFELSSTHTHTQILSLSECKPLSPIGFDTY